ncbi:MAG TPA: leucine-rich repeat protein, partial [Bacilli bacterium]|nr:leucine-rich repeat protein [Bacilli bacterium]
TSFNIPSTITLIESYAFAVNTQVEEISVPGTITTIEADAFRKLINCTLRVSAPSRPSGWSYNWATEYYAIIWNS